MFLPPISLPPLSLRRRGFLAATAGTLLAAGGVAHAADAPLPERSLGKPDARVTVQEFFSLTCIHCAAFTHDVFPEIKEKLINTGRIRWVFRDFPLDKLALAAAQVARSLPPERYDPFIEALLATQMRWAFARDVNNMDEMFKMAALAGLSRAQFDAAVADKKLESAILAEIDVASKKYGVDATPTFVANEQKKAGEVDYASFAKWMEELGA